MLEQVSTRRGGTPICPACKQSQWRIVKVDGGITALACSTLDCPVEVISIEPQRLTQENMQFLEFVKLLNSVPSPMQEILLNGLEIASKSQSPKHDIKRDIRPEGGGGHYI